MEPICNRLTSPSVCTFGVDRHNDCGNASYDKCGYQRLSLLILLMAIFTSTNGQRMDNVI